MNFNTILIQGAEFNTTSKTSPRSSEFGHLLKSIGYRKEGIEIFDTSFEY